MRHVPVPSPFAAPRTTALALAVALTLSAGLAAPPPAAAQEPAADALLRDFAPTGDYVVEIDGEPADKAEIFLSERVPGFLILSSRLPEPALLVPRAGTVETLSLMKLARRADGSIDVLADAELVPSGRFTIEDSGETIRFAVGGHRLALKPRPFLLGLQDVDTMLGHSPEYRRTAAAYRPDDAALAALRSQEEPVRVRVYFGSWCPYCKRYVPNLLKVAQELTGSKLRFEFYGLPKEFSGEPQAEADDVHGVPTGVVFVAGREVGRIEGNDWRRPEATLQQMLTGGAAR